MAVAVSGTSLQRAMLAVPAVGAQASAVRAHAMGRATNVALFYVATGPGPSGGAFAGFALAFTVLAAIEITSF